MKKDILKDLLAKPGKKHLVSDFDSSFTGDLSKQDAKEQLAKDIEKLSELQSIMKYLNKETNGITLSRIGLGAMRMADIQQGVDTIHAALDSGITYLTFMVTEKVDVRIDACWLIEFNVICA